MSLALTGSLSDHSNKQARRLSFSSLFNQTQSSRRGKHEEAPTMKRFGVNFYLIKINGLLPISRLRQYRIAVRSGDRKKVTSWKTPGKDGFPVGETSEGMDITMMSQITFTIERRNYRLRKPFIVAESGKLTISELTNDQGTHHLISGSEPLTVELRLKTEPQPVTLELNVRLYNLSSAQKSDLPDGESRAKLVFEEYPRALSSATRALSDLIPTLDLSKQTSYSMLFEFVSQMGKYMKDYSREEMTYDIENNAWYFLREATKYMHQQSKSRSSDQFHHLTNSILRGFWLLFQLHRSQKFDLDNQQVKFIEEELLEIGHSFTRKTNFSAPKTVPPNSQYPQLRKLKGVEMTLPRLQGQGSETLLHHNSTFHEIARWMVNPEAEQQVLWLHGKLEPCTKNNVAATFLEASKVIGFPAVYYSFAQGGIKKEDDQSGLRDMLDNMIYQFSLIDSTIADAFDVAIKENEGFQFQDFYSRSQFLLRTLLSLSYAEHAKMYPSLLLIDDLEPSNSTSSVPEYDQLLQILHAASNATHQASLAPSPVFPSPDSSFSPDISSSSAPNAQRASLPFPPFLRIVVLSRSLGNNPSLIEQFACIRDGHRLIGTRNSNDKATKLYSCAVNGPNKGKGKERASSETPSLIPIAEVNSQAGLD